MAKPVLYRFELSLRRDKQVGDSSQVPYLAQIDFYRQGATVLQTTPFSGGESKQIDVHDIGSITVPILAGNYDIVEAGVGGPRFEVTFVNGETNPALLKPPPFRPPFPEKNNNLMLRNLGTAAVTIPSGTRLILLTRRPSAFADPTGTIPLGSSVVTDAAGRLGVYLPEPRFDYIVRGVPILASSSKIMTADHTISWTHPGAPLQNFVLVGISWNGIPPPLISQVTYGTQLMTLVFGTPRTAIYRLNNPPSGSQLVTVAFDPSAPTLNAVAGALSLANVDLGIPPVPATSAGTGPQAAVAFPTPAPNGATIAVLALTPTGGGVLGTATPDRGQTDHWNLSAGLLNDAVRGAASSKGSAAQGGTDLAWRISSGAGPWEITGAQVMPVAGATTRLFVDARAGTQPTPSWIDLRDFASLQAAVNALPPEGGEIFIPAGLYSLTSGVVISKPNVTLRGEGTSSVLRSSMANPTFDLITVDGSVATADRFRLLNVQLDGRAAQAGNYSALVLKGTSSAPLLRCVLENVILVNAAKHGLHLQYVRRLSATNCEVTGCKNDGLRIENARLLLFMGCWFQSNVGRGAYVTGTAITLTFLGCTFMSNKGGALPSQANALDVDVVTSPPESASAAIAVIACHFEHADTSQQATQFVRLSGAVASSVNGCFFQGRTTALQKPFYAAALLSSGARFSNNTGENMATGLANFSIWGTEFGNTQIGASYPTITGSPMRLVSVDGKGVAKFPSYVTADRPKPDKVPAGSLIWFQTGLKLQVSDGAAWVDVGP